ncbi:ATP-binding cassette domain-containing protein [Pedobacter sp. HDW13]|uniref:ABC transporter ATP-binding protein n=1 Tax=unclassified Pedobacter TaxID=2628915 RepID=UPI000F5A9E56|nr:MULTISPECIES: ATP-binding cassette domain-containing protein [unclassified Pedobacter]QIL39800.1 ATP-binding cassette domain-containing protein [Pedobacter sp. HDW13]RQO79718.1 ABC transporter ATP-binding protein [Pedobacter sp. KBW01]
MSNYAIETVGLNFNFGNQAIVKDLSLQVPKGSIYGFLGPNGAGKTTTIKILLNLLQSPSDQVFIFGKEINHNRIAILKRVGALVEQPAIYGHLSGKENLINRCILLGIRKSKASEMLALVGLTDAADKKSSKYSLGMKQRLGIALALVSDPELLLLDEPTNGLDPNGIIEVRNLMIELAAKHHKTILVSSHLLAEIERTATHVGIINKGQLLFQGTIDELHLLSKPVLEIDVNDIERASALLLKSGYEIVNQTDKKITIPFTSAQHSAALNTLLVQNGFMVSSLYQQRKDLENLFLDITNNN